MKVLSGSYTSRDYDGQILIDGKPVEFTSVKVAEENGIEMVYQELNMVLEASLAENLFIGNLPGKGVFVDYKALYARTREVLKEIELDVDPQVKAASLGSGQLQMLAIMRAIQKSPRILVLDEPTSALDDNEVNILFRFLEKMRRKGVSCIFITHKLDEVFRIANRVVVMRDGQFVSARGVADVTQEQLIEEMVGRKVETLYPQGHAEIGEVVMTVENLSVPHPTIRGRNIVDNISFQLRKGGDTWHRRPCGCRAKRDAGRRFRSTDTGRDKKDNGERKGMQHPVAARRHSGGHCPFDGRTQKIRLCRRVQHS